ncbi:MAG: undecaprenyl-diphosphate phosphatase [Lachnospiraceae bacterium]|nr:undecaprenyl-diphosphate phosphatase [Lachnospiraceae bacterium]
MSFGQAIAMGIVQGLTEFLPVSSSGHLAILKNILNVDTDTGILFDVLLHVATLIAVFLVFYKDIIKLLSEFVKIAADSFSNTGRFFSNLFAKDDKKPYKKLGSTSYRRFVIMIIISTIPTAVIGVLLKNVVEGVSGNLLVTGICLLGTGGILLLSDFVEERHKKPKDASYADAAAVGTAQGIATLPGLSRSGCTIVAGLLCGFDRKFAVKYSFIMSMPAILGALILELKDIESGLSGAEIGAYIVGMIFALVVGYVALVLTVRLVMSKYFKFFSYYCFAVGAISLVVFIAAL